ncbi:4744_t:CDS:2, partial [Ambispora gerdemannii]
MVYIGQIALQKFNYQHITCYAHALQLAINESLKECSELIDKAKTLNNALVYRDKYRETLRRRIQQLVINDTQSNSNNSSGQLAHWYRYPSVDNVLFHGLRQYGKTSIAYALCEDNYLGALTTVCIYSLTNASKDKSSSDFGIHLLTVFGQADTTIITLDEFDSIISTDANAKHHLHDLLAVLRSFQRNPHSMDKYYQPAEDYAGKQLPSGYTFQVELYAFDPLYFEAQTVGRLYLMVSGRRSNILSSGHILEAIIRRQMDEPLEKRYPPRDYPKVNVAHVFHAMNLPLAILKLGRTDSHQVC